MRSEQYIDGYRAAWKDAITHLRSVADEMNDAHAKHLLRGAAFDLGNMKGYKRLAIDKQFQIIRAKSVQS